MCSSYLFLFLSMLQIRPINIFLSKLINKSEQNTEIKEKKLYQISNCQV